MTAPIGCLDGEQAIRDALAAGPTPGPWFTISRGQYWHEEEADVLRSDGEDLVQAEFVKPVGDVPTTRGQMYMRDAEYIAACHPETMRALLAELDRLRSASRQEGWQPIDENYFVSRGGLVKDKKGNLLGQWKNDQGYLLVRLSSPRRVERVHRLVAAAFVQNPRGLNTVNHIDCDRSNNVSSNLEWCTQAENIQHAGKLGRMARHWAGKRSPNAALSDDQVRLVRMTYAHGGISLQKLGLQFGVSKRCIGRIISREVYANVQ